MPGTVKIWWHDGATKDVRYNELPVVNEPELGFETGAVGRGADADPVSSKPLPATGFSTNSIGVAKNCTISFVEV